MKKIALNLFYVFTMSIVFFVSSAFCTTCQLADDEYDIIPIQYIFAIFQDFVYLYHLGVDPDPGKWILIEVDDVKY